MAVSLHVIPKQPNDIVYSSTTTVDDTPIKAYRSEIKRITLATKRNIVEQKWYALAAQLGHRLILPLYQYCFYIFG